MWPFCRYVFSIRRSSPSTKPSMSGVSRASYPATRGGLVSHVAGRLERLVHRLVEGARCGLCRSENPHRHATLIREPARHRLVAVTVVPQREGLSSHTSLNRALDDRSGPVLDVPDRGTRARRPGRDRDQELREVKRREEHDRRAVGVRRAESLAAAEAGNRMATVRQAVSTPAGETRAPAHPTPPAPFRDTAYQLLPRATVTASPLIPEALSLQRRRSPRPPRAASGRGPAGPTRPAPSTPDRPWSGAGPPRARRPLGHLGAHPAWENGVRADAERASVLRHRTRQPEQPVLGGGVCAARMLGHLAAGRASCRPRCLRRARPSLRRPARELDGASRFTRIVSRHTSGSCSQITRSWADPMPWFTTSTSIGPGRRSVSATAVSRPPGRAQVGHDVVEPDRGQLPLAASRDRHAHTRIGQAAAPPRGRSPDPRR